MYNECAKSNELEKVWTMDIYFFIYPYFLYFFKISFTGIFWGMEKRNPLKWEMDMPRFYGQFKQKGYWSVITKAECLPF